MQPAALLDASGPGVLGDQPFISQGGTLTERLARQVPAPCGAGTGQISELTESLPCLPALCPWFLVLSLRQTLLPGGEAPGTTASHPSSGLL